MPIERTQQGRAQGAPATELAWVSAVARGDRQAFEQLYRSYYPRLFGYLSRMLPRREEVEEAVDDVLLAVWRGAERFRGDSTVSTWIFGIAYRRACKSLRRTDRTATTLDLELHDTAAADSPVLDLVAKENRALIDRALQTLAFDQRAAVYLTYFEGLAYLDIARVLDCPVNTVKTRVFHAKRRLRKLLEGEPAGDGALP